MIAVISPCWRMVEPEASEYGQAMGLWMLARSGETVRLVNDETFHPKAW